MNKELYQKLFTRMNELGAIRKDLSFGCEMKVISTWWTTRIWKLFEYYEETWYIKCISSSWWILTTNDRNRRFKQSWEIEEIIWHPPLLQDALWAVCKVWLDAQGDKYDGFDLLPICKLWDDKIHLEDQSDELWKALLWLLTK